MIGLGWDGGGGHFDATKERPLLPQASHNMDPPQPFHVQKRDYLKAQGCPKWNTVGADADTTDEEQQLVRLLAEVDAVLSVPAVISYLTPQSEAVEAVVKGRAGPCPCDVQLVLALGQNEVAVPVMAAEAVGGLGQRDGPRPLLALAGGIGRLTPLLLEQALEWQKAQVRGRCDGGRPVCRASQMAAC